MHCFPAYEDAKRYAALGFDTMPVAASILSDFITPMEALRILKHVSSHVYLLESAKKNGTWGRWSFLGYEPRMEITCIDHVMHIQDLELETWDPVIQLRQIMDRHRSPRIHGMPPFAGGLVGWFSYDAIQYAEPSAKVSVQDPDAFRDLDLMLFDTVIAFDHQRQQILLIATVDLHCLDVSWNRAQLQIAHMKDLLETGTRAEEPVSRLVSDIRPLFDRQAWRNMVQLAKGHIHDGDIFQIVLSNRLSAEFEGTLLETYRHLRTINPSPYMFYFSGTDVEVAGASPETLVKLEDGRLSTFPLAGTRKRGATEEEDLVLEAELLADEKELAEHDMLVDLGRNDLGRVCRPGSVQVETLHEVQRFSHVMHLASTVTGQIRTDLDALDAIQAVLPAGTLSGAPKIRACQLIGELEGTKRGIYGGCIGYLDFSGNMDMCIAIRLVYHKNGQVFVRSGAGIVADSDPEKEYEECLNKARSSLSALLRAQEDRL